MTAPYAISLNDTLVGHLVERPDGFWAFSFTTRYRESNRRPVLGQKFEDDLEKTYLGKKPGRLPSFFAHLVPEGRLRRVLEHSLKLEDPSDAQLLAAVSRDLPGAVELALATGDVSLNNDEAPSPGSEPPSDIEPGLRFSLGGNQLKFSMMQEDERFTLPAHTAVGSWIVKIAPADYRDLVSNEFAIMEWARAAGFDVPALKRLQPTDLGAVSRWVERGSSAIAVSRYDRNGGRKLHQEDFAQIIGTEPTPSGSDKYHQSYDNLVKLTSSIIGTEAAEEQLLRIAFVVASGNADAHLKNFSILYQDGITPTLAPLYDQVATVAWSSHGKDLALKLAGSRDFGTLRLSSFKHLATKAGLDPVRCGRLVSMRIEALRDTWAAALAAGLTREHATAIANHWKRVPLLREHGALD